MGKSKIHSQYKRLRANENGDAVQVVLIIAIIVVIFIVATGGLVDGVVEEKTPVPEPDKTYTTNAELTGVVLVLFGIFLLGALIAGIVTISTRIKTASRVGADHIAGWQALIDHHAKIRSEWMAYETDIMKMIDFPLLSDMSEPVTIKLYETMHTALIHAPKSAKLNRNIPFSGSDYDVAVRELDTAFRAAESKARLSSWNKFTVEEKKRLQRAKDLLAMAMDGASTPSERQAAYKQAIKTLNGLIEVPKATILALESTTQLALTA